MSSVSVLIPTFNRPDFVRSLLQFYRHHCFREPILVADSSESPHRETNRQLYHEVEKELDLHVEFYDPDIKLIDKVCALSTAVNTPYVVLCADDDFILPGAIEQCAKFLDSNPDYSAAHGAGIMVRSDGVYSDYPQRSIEMPNALDRLNDLMGNFNTSVYSVHRSGQFQHVLAATVQAAEQYRYARFGDIILMCFDVLHGKTKRLETLYIVRRHHTTRESMCIPNWCDFVTDLEFSGQYASFRDCVGEKLSLTANIELQQAKQEVDVAFRHFMITRYLSRYPSGIPGKENRTVRNVMRRLLISRRTVRKFLSYLTKSSVSKKTIRQLPFREEFGPIYRTIMGDSRQWEDDNRSRADAA